VTWKKSVDKTKAPKFEENNLLSEEEEEGRFDVLL
jgi:hypothetical protein